MAVQLVQREQFGVTAPRDAGVVEHQVETSGARDDVVDDGLDRGDVGHVKMGPAGAERCRRALRAVTVDIGADDVGACSHQRPAQCGADARARAGDDGLFARAKLTALPAS